MTIIPILIDSRPAYLQREGAQSTLLLTPAGTRTLLETTCEALKPIVAGPVTIITTHAADSEYEARLRQTTTAVAQIATIDRVDQVLDRHEPSDWLLFIDPRQYPVEVNRLRDLTRGISKANVARHLVALDHGNRGTKEYVQLDAQGRVQRIQRLYDGVTWLQTRAVAASLVSASAIHGLSRSAFADLGQLRAQLVSRGAVSSDLVLTGGVLDLRREVCLLQLNELLLTNLTNASAPPSFEVRAPGIWIARSCQVHPTARLYGPLVLCEGAHVERDTTLIGPVLIGQHSRIGRGATVTDCLVAPGSVVARQSKWHNRLVCGQARPGHTATDVGALPARSEGGAERVRFTLAAHSTNGRSRRKQREAYVALKRILDGVTALLALIVLSPLLVLTAAAIKLTSRGPVFFQHQREGKSGKPFNCYKFRTMTADAHQQQRELYKHNAVDGPQFKLDRDPRITRVGHWLRVSNVDELPQLVNVVLGQMSLIGPRPSPFRENQICVPWREARLAVRPGITGLWQICRHQRSAGDFHQWIHYDMLYVQHVSPRIDLKILAVTLLTAGGRWSVPVTWLIPRAALRPGTHARVTARTPILAFDASGPNRAEQLIPAS